ncbi:FYVE, RhoGEF and PH domain-containing protein 3 Zinc finger FYVE domain-containing protein 5 [Channa argus]|uniref:FYVE, RhoGEF and PH domain-containing protein 3 Zinc finger FYVE domain-containing protein 5 n=1 Tax=Channa argus TaxID=215402 RepID=A0A6G1Q478_CHAAH|nr:FYVE, RhoGEF and PH domain-containing protein 3 Zinc finger FYVE domain-containing protein 5 [Channa argus]
MQGVSATDLPAPPLQYQCGSVDYLCSPRLVKKNTTRPCHDRPAIKPRPQPSTSPKPPTAQKPQVPPKPVHLLALGQDKKPKRIPPAPSRPLPAPPPPPKPKPILTPPGLGAQPQREAQKVGLLIERFENSRVPILGVLPRSQLHLCLRMDTASDITSSCNQDSMAKAAGDSSSIDKIALDTSEKTDEVSELSCLGSMHINGSDDPGLEDIVEDDITHSVGCFGDREQEGGSSQELLDNPDSSEQNGKIPNRDSGIDSPSCAAEGEGFPNEGAIDEEDNYDSVTETESVSCVTLGNKRDSTQDEDSDLDEGSSGEIHSLTDAHTGYLTDTNPEAHKCSEAQKLLNIAKELLHTEEAYVKRLNLLDQVFCTKLTEAGIPQDVITGIFSNISSIYCFHDKFLLPELKTRITGEWDSNPRIGDILQKLAPFMKMYGEYVKNFDRAMDLVNTWTQRSSQFKSVVQNIQKQDVCGNLTLQHHMLEPVQRIPRYELLLKDYLKKLPDDALDRKDAEKALELISTAANHSNAAIRKMEKMHKLLEVYERLGGEEDIVNPANELIKEGHIKKMSAKNGTAQDRYLYLFNNMVLYCVPKLRLMGQKFSVRERIDIAGMEVQENVKQNLPHTFAIIGKQRSLELQARTAEEKEDWIQVIQATIERHKQNSETFNKAFNSSFSREDDHLPESPSPWCSTSVDSDSEKVHERKSSKKKEKEKQTCKGCNENFNFTKRKHHCKACGAAICAKCSKTLDNKTSRVCPECFEASLENVSVSEQKKKSGPERQISLMAENCLQCGHLQVQDKGKNWTKLWVSITKAEPLVLYLQSNGQDTKGARAVPLPGFEVSIVAPSAGEKSEIKHALQLHHPQQTLLLSAQDPELQAKWMNVLSKAAHGEIPTDASMSLTEHRKSQ